MKFLFIFLTLIFSVSEASAVCVISSTANLRSGPGPNHPISWVVPKYMPLIEVKRVGNWYLVEDLDGEQHYVYKSNVSASSKLKCVAVKVPTAKLRKGPGESSELADIRQVDRYTPFKRVDAVEAWYEVISSWGESYWIHESNVWRPVVTKKVQF